MVNPDNNRENSEHATGLRWHVFALACGTSFLLYLHRYTWNIVGAKLQEQLHLSNTQSGFLFSLFYYTYAAGQIPSGMIIDRYGPHVVLSVIVVAWSLALAAIGQTAHPVFVGVYRLVFGAAQAGCYPALNKVTRSWFPAASRTFLQGWIATTSGRAGAALSPIVLGTVLMGACGLSWEHSLTILGLSGMGFGLIFWRLFRNTPSDHPGVNLAERTLIEAGSPAAAPSARATLPFRHALRNRSLRFFIVQQFLDAGSDVAFVSLIGKYFLVTRGFNVSATGWLVSLPLLGGALGGIVGGWLNDFCIGRTGSRRWSRSGIGFAGKVLGCLFLALVLRQSSGVAVALTLMLAKFFSDWSQPTVWGTCTDLGGHFSATVFSIINTAGTLGGVVMPIIFGAILDWYTTSVSVGGRTLATTNWNPLFLLLAAMYLGSGLSWLMIDCTQTIDDKDKPSPSAFSEL